ncbi:MAG: hypothetical protein M1274_04845, partial [Actinobacteria bacterium]|nr:hypothetical protein [Actinomycetota bacterium]
MSRPDQVAAQEDDEQPREMRCTRHPGKATNLRCGRCERPFCYSCLVRTPVGLRCFDCATPRRFPGRSATPQQYLAAVALGLAVSLFLGAFWALVPAIG